MLSAELASSLRLVARNLIDPSNDPNIGSARGDNKTQTTEALGRLGLEATTSGMALLSTFLPALTLAVICFLIFLLCRRTQRRFYSPKSYLGHIHQHERSPELPKGFINWISSFLRLPDSHVLRHSSLDGYFFLRFLKKMSVVCLVGCFITWPVLFPIHITGGAGNTQLDALNFSNVVDPKRYYAHTLVAWIFFAAFVFFMVTRESILYATLRQAYLLSPLYANRISSRTVLFMAVPEAYLSKAKLSKIFGETVRRIWIASDTKNLAKLVKERDKLAYQLEEAETKFVKKAHAARLKLLKEQPYSAETTLEAGSASRGSNDKFESEPWVAKVKRPSHRPKYFCKEVDSIEYFRSKLAVTIPNVNTLQEKHRAGEAETLSAVFIEFSSQTDAQIAFQTLSHHHPFQMTPRYIGIAPDQVLWSALHYSWWGRIVRKFAIKGSIAILIVFWSVPSAFIGSISNIAYLTNLLPFLRFINDLPTFIKGTITGLLPAAGLALLMALVPMLLRWLARQSGVPSHSHAELFTQSAHFCFQVVQVFLVTTLTSAASAATSQIIKDPLSAKDLLAKNLPKATNFYISYFLFQGLVLSAGAVVQVIAFLIFKLLRIFRDTTPRKLYDRWASLAGVNWGTVFPIFTNMAVIAITYSCIAPLVLGFASLGLYMVYQAYRYNLFYVYYPIVDTKGLVYPRALQQILTGVYLAEVCMIGLFAIRGAIGPMILMGLYTLVTVLAHVSLNDALSPLLTALPRTLNNEDDWATAFPLDPEKGSSAAFESMQDISKEFQPRRQSTLTLTEFTSSHHTLRQKLKIIADWLLRPSIYANYAELRAKIRQDPGILYDSEISDNAYFPAPVNCPTPLLWIPRDVGGVSQREIELTQEIIPITDDAAHLNEKNKVVWDKIGMKPPIWEEKVFY
ncbi:hypothetical protein FQN57_002899 [Myotisia sp. PD_48]|nr:hypothetical protein FQN57_002899 [Myotisia sp. PD_48]